MGRIGTQTLPSFLLANGRTSVVLSARDQRRRGAHEAVVGFGAGLFEGGAVLGADRVAWRVPAVLRDRVDVLAVALQNVVQMRTGREAGCADAADDLALRDVHAGADAGAER